MDLDNTEKSGGGRLFIFPAFYAGQYEFFIIMRCAKDSEEMP